MYNVIQFNDMKPVGVEWQDMGCLYVDFFDDYLFDYQAIIKCAI